MLIFSPQRLQEARLASDLSQSQLARRMDTREQNITRWEGGLNLPNANAVAAMAHATGRDIDFFYAQVGDDEDEKEAALRRKARALADSVDPDLGAALYDELQVRHGSRRERVGERSTS